MPVEAKPLFRPEVLKTHLAHFQLPPVDEAKLSHWSNLIASGRLDEFGEEEILRDFLNDFFVGLLGYTRPAGHERYTIGWEHHVQVAGKTIRPDGTFKDDMNLVRGYWEAKDTDDNLDKEIEKKRKAGYPFNNFNFEDSALSVVEKCAQARGKSFDTASA